MRARKCAFANYLVVILTLLWSAALVSGPVWASAAPNPQTALPSSVSKAQVVEGYGRLPLCFIENQGQTDSQVKFFTQGRGHSIFFTSEGAVLSLSRSTKGGRGGKKGKGDRAVVKLRPQGIRSDVEILATEPLPGKVNYFRGNDPGKWRTEVPTYKSVLYREAYKGIDLKFYGAGQQLEYDLVVKPGADPKQVKFLYQGVKALKVGKEGDLTITLPNGGKLVQQRPVIYQEINGQRISREGKFRLLPGTGNRGYGFELASYDTRYPLIIDPVVLVYSTFLGGAVWESGNAIAVDASGSAYVVGTTQSPDFPHSVNQVAFGGPPDDAFISKFNPAGSALVYSSFLGGADSDFGLGVAVDAANNAYVTGETFSTNFPIAGTPIKGTFGGVNTAFVSKLDATGLLTYSTYLGGTTDGTGANTASDIGVSIAVDTAGKAYVSGTTSSTDFPTVAATRVQDTLLGTANGFVAAVDPAVAGPAGLVYSTYLGGAVSENMWGITVDPAGVFIYVAGDTSSLNFPVTNGSALQGASDAFVTKLSTTGSVPVFSTYWGGTGFDSGNGGVALDAAGNFYVAGTTDSTDFTTTAGAFQTALNGVFNTFVTKFSSVGTPVYSTYLGGEDIDEAWWITVDQAGNAYVTGDTSSLTFPIVTANSFKTTLPGSFNAFVTKLNPTGNLLVFSTYLGGSVSDSGFGVAVDANARVYVTGVTTSADFPFKGAIKTTMGSGGSAAFVTKLATMAMAPQYMLLELLD